MLRHTCLQTTHQPTTQGPPSAHPANPTVLRCCTAMHTPSPTFCALAGAKCLAAPASTAPVASCAPQIPFTHFLALSGAELAGAFLGACLVFLHYVRRSMEGSHLQPQ